MAPLFINGDLIKKSNSLGKPLPLPQLIKNQNVNITKKKKKSLGKTSNPPNPLPRLVPTCKCMMSLTLLKIVT